MSDKPRRGASLATRSAADHQAAVQEFLATARAVPERNWERPIASGKWSPAQIAEHLRLTYVIAQNELAGGSGMKVRTSWWLRAFLRWRLLPRILKTGQLPEGARASRELRPGDGPFDREQLLSALATSARNAEESIVRHWDDRPVHLTHHIFGGLDAATTMRFATVHTRHHARQIAERAAG